MARHKIRDNFDIAFLTILSPHFLTDRTTATMGASWQTPEQRAFIEEHFLSYSQHSTDKTLKTGFWPGFFDKWFKSWPLPEPSPDLVNSAGSMKKAKKAERDKKVNVSTVYPLMD